tara:strand:+ start:128 stop:676 length:549 start_codon:yes stop_codon:yes gene_type:complete
MTTPTQQAIRNKFDENLIVPEKIISDINKRKMIKSSHASEPMKTDWTNPDIKNTQRKILEESLFIDVKPYSHNIIGIMLRQLEAMTSKEYTYDTIIKFNLHKRGWRVSEEYIKEKGIEMPDEEECKRYERKMIRDAHYILARNAVVETSESDSSESDSEDSCDDCEIICNYPGCEEECCVKD